MTKQDGLFTEALVGLRGKRAMLRAEVARLQRQITSLSGAIRVMEADEAPEATCETKTVTLHLLADRRVRSDSDRRVFYSVEAFANGSFIEYRCECMAFRYAKTTPYLHGGKEHCKHIRRANQGGFPDEARRAFAALRMPRPR